MPRRAARSIYGEIVGYGATSDGYDMVAPSGEGAERCMRMALDDREGAGRLHQPARDLDAGRRSAGNRGDPQRVRHRRQVPADFGDQVADRPFARRHRRAGSDLFAADDEERLHLRERATSENSIRCSPTCRSCASASTTPSSAPCCRTPSASAAPTPRWCSSGWMHDAMSDLFWPALVPRPLSIDREPELI